MPVAEVELVELCNFEHTDKPEDEEHSLMMTISKDRMKKKLHKNLSMRKTSFTRSEDKTKPKTQNQILGQVIIIKGMNS